jgi:hypothetical protein
LDWTTGDRIGAHLSPRGSDIKEVWVFNSLQVIFFLDFIVTHIIEYFIIETSWCSNFGPTAI